MGRFVLVPFIPGDLALRAATYVVTIVSLIEHSGGRTGCHCVCSVSLCWGFIFFFFGIAWNCLCKASSNVATVKWYRNWNRKWKFPTTFWDFSSFIFVPYLFKENFYFSFHVLRNFCFWSQFYWFIFFSESRKARVLHFKLKGYLFDICFKCISLWPVPVALFQRMMLI